MIPTKDQTLSLALAPIFKLARLLLLYGVCVIRFNCADDYQRLRLD